MAGAQSSCTSPQQYGYNQQQYPQQQQQSGGSKFGFGSGMVAGGAALLAGKLISNVVGGVSQVVAMFDAGIGADECDVDVQRHHDSSGGGMFGGGGGYGHSMGP